MAREPIHRRLRLDALLERALARLFVYPVSGMQGEASASTV